MKQKADDDQENRDRYGEKWMVRHPSSKPAAHQFLCHKLRSGRLGVDEEIQGVVEKDEGIGNWCDVEEHVDPF